LRERRGTRLRQGIVLVARQEHADAPHAVAKCWRRIGSGGVSSYPPLSIDGRYALSQDNVIGLVEPAKSPRQGD
jgi:hypothetical protein